MSKDPVPRTAAESREPEPTRPLGIHSVKMAEACPEGYDGTCLRPLGLCELGGSCEVCWYRPDHPRFRSGS
jgi:hypothetical protein